MWQSRANRSLVSVHKGYKVQAALCCDRLPLVSRQIAAFEEWRKYHEEWQIENACNVRPSNDLVFMRFPFHWLESPEEKEYKKRQQITGTKAEKGNLSGVDALLDEEGLDFDFQSYETKSTTCSAGPKVDVGNNSAAAEDVRDPQSRKERCLWLVVRYRGENEWQFPTIDHTPTESMRETLQKMWLNHFGPKTSAHYVGMTPFAVRKSRYDASTEAKMGLKGRKTFFYRSHWLPSYDTAAEIPRDSPVEDWRFATRDELSTLLSRENWRTVRYGLPLEHLNEK